MGDENEGDHVEGDKIEQPATGTDAPPENPGDGEQQADVQQDDGDGDGE